MGTCWMGSVTQSLPMHRSTPILVRSPRVLQETSCILLSLTSTWLLRAPSSRPATCLSKDAEGRALDSSTLHFFLPVSHCGFALGLLILDVLVISV